MPLNYLLLLGFILEFVTTDFRPIFPSNFLIYLTKHCYILIDGKNIFIWFDNGLTEREGEVILIALQPHYDHLDINAQHGHGQPTVTMLVSC